MSEHGRLFIAADNVSIELHTLNILPRENTNFANQTIEALRQLSATNLLFIPHVQRSSRNTIRSSVLKPTALNYARFDAGNATTCLHDTGFLTSR